MDGAQGSKNYQGIEDPLHHLKTKEYWVKKEGDAFGEKAILVRFESKSKSGRGKKATFRS